jgi:hypothetical protein
MDARMSSADLVHVVCRPDLAAPAEPNAAVALERRPQCDFEPTGALGAIAGRNRHPVGNGY